jgi:hypothetical protein
MDSQKIRRNTALITSLLVAAVGLFIIAGCSSIKQTNFWMDPSYHAGPMKKILVVAMRRDALTRRMWEDAIVNAINGKDNSGTTAVASYELFPENVPDTLNARQKTEEDNFDGVLLIANSSLDTTSNYVPGYSSIEPVTVYNGWRNRYYTYYANIYHEGYTETDSLISIRTDLLATKDGGKMIWSVTSQALNPSSREQIRIEVAEKVEALLKKKKLIY